MALRTQMRLEQLTGSLVAPESIGSKVALASMPAEHLGDILDEMGQAIARIHGEKDFTNKDAGVFTHTESVFEGKMRVTQAAYMSGSIEVAQAAQLKSTLQVTGESTLASAIISDLTESRITFAGPVGELVDSDSLKWDGSDLIAASAKISDLTESRITFAGADGALVDSADLIFDASGLAINNDLSAINADFSGDVGAVNATLSGDISAVNATLSGDLSAVNATLSSDLSAVNGSFSGNVSAVNATLSGDLSAANATLSGDLSAANATLSANLSAANATLSGDLSAVNATLSADLSAVNATLSADLSAVNATLSGDLSAVNGSFSGDVDAVNATLSGDLSAVSGSFSGDVSISGNLIVSGATTTIDTQNLLVEDPLIVLAKNQTTSATLDQGLVFQRQGDNQGMIWDESSDEFAFVNIGAEDGTTEGDVSISSYAKLHIGDLAAIDAVFSGDVSAVSGSFSGDMSVAGALDADSAAITGLVQAGSADISGNADIGGNAIIVGDVSAVDASFSGALDADSAAITGAITAGSADIAGELAANTIKIDGDVATRLYIVDGDGSMKDEPNLLFDQTKLSVTGNEEVSGYLRAAKIEIDSAQYYIDSDNVAGAMTLSANTGMFKMQQGGTDFMRIQKDSFNTKLVSKDLIFMKDDVTPAEVARIDVVKMALVMSGSHQIQFNDASEAIWSSGAELQLKSNGVEYKWPQADAAAANYVLASNASGQLSWISAASASASTAFKSVTKATATVAAGSVYPTSGTPYSDALLAAKDAKLIDIYVNGQLMNSNKQTAVNTYDTAPDYDASINTTDGKIKFAFQIEADDIISVIGR